MDDANIDSALKALANLPPCTELGVMQYFYDPDPQMNDTGIVFTVAELCEILEVARGQAWRDAETDPPDDEREVLVQLHAGPFYVATYIKEWLRWSLCCDDRPVRRWRELPR